MNTNYIENLYRQCMAAGFQAVGQNMVPLSDAAGFTLGKEEGTTLCLLQVTDLTRLDADVFLYLKEVEIQRANAMSSMYSSIWVVFVLVDDESYYESHNKSHNKAKFPKLKADPYFGQSPYAVYWHVKPADHKVTVQDGQPDDIMGLKAMVNASFTDIYANDSERSEDSPFLPIHPHHPYPDHLHLHLHPDEAKFDEAKSGTPICTLVLAATNVLIMFLMYHQGYAQNPLLVAANFGAIIPYLIWEHGEYYRLFTAMFIHFGWAHLSFNVAGMLIFGTRIERYCGKGAFLAIYFMSGLTASVASLLFTRGFSAGASGAVYGLLGAAFVYTRYTKRPMDIINNHVILIYIIIGLGMGFVLTNIDNFGHIGGLLAGMLAGYIALRVRKS